MSLIYFRTENLFQNIINMANPNQEYPGIFVKDCDIFIERDTDRIANLFCEYKIASFNRSHCPNSNGTNYSVVN